MHRCITPILCAVLLSSVLGNADAASPARITLHLSVTGAITQQVTWSHAETLRAETLGQISYGCIAIPHNPRNPDTPSFNLNYNPSNLNASHPGFYLTVYGYSRSQHQYNLRSTGALVELALRGKVYQPPLGQAGAADGTVEVQNGGRSGSLRITHLATIFSPKRQITVTGSWHCDTMSK
jgi:hypothetical protein